MVATLNELAWLGKAVNELDGQFKPCFSMSVKEGQSFCP